MTYKQLLKVLSKLDDKQLNRDITIEFDEELYPDACLVINDDKNGTDMLDEGHPYISVNTLVTIL